MSAISEDWAPEPMKAISSESTAAGWKTRLLTGKRGGILGNVANALTALRYASVWQGVLHFNESSFATVGKAVPPFEHTPAVPFDWADEHDILTAAWLQEQGISVNKEISGQAVQVVAREHCFHPVRDYLDSLKWDGIGRLDGWLTLYLGANPSDYVRAVGSKLLIAGVARVYRPGVKVDTCLILEGQQGLQKSTALQVLAGEKFFSDDIAELGSKDSVLQTRGKWIIELGELDAMGRPETSRVKAFISRQVDYIRPPYGRRAINAPRECIFVGSTNKTDYLRDETGGRRFWPVECGRIDIEALKRDRDQLWAEARERFRSGEKWWLDSEALVVAAAAEQEARYEGDTWDEKIEEFVLTRESVSLSEILEESLQKRPENWTRADQMRISRSLKSKGWTRNRGPQDEHGNRPWRYTRGPNIRGLPQRQS